jgi:competence protein ComEC
VLSYYWWVFHPEDNLRIIFFDVGQGDSILIISPDKKTLLIDGGKDDKALAQLVNNPNFLFNRHLDYVLATHADNDHIGGLDQIISSFSVGTFMMPESHKETKGYQDLRKLVKNTTSHTVDITDNSDFNLGCCVAINFVWPQVSSKLLDYDKENSISAAFILIYKDFSAFFAGDLPGEIEEYVFKQGRFDVDLLKVSHHGSKSSTDEVFVSIARPEIAIISVGKNNSYHHPDIIVTNRLKNHNAKLIRTDESGSINFVTDGVTFNY